MFRKLLPFLLLVVLLAALSACGSLITSSDTGTPEPILQPTEEVLPVDVPAGPGGLPPEDAVGLQPIEVGHVGVEIGVGSPIPVTAQIAGTWPTLCAQIGEISMVREGNQFHVTLMANPGPDDCPPDNMGLPFGMGLPINATGDLADGEYTVTVNGVSATFQVPLTPTVPVDPDTGAPVDTPPEGGEPGAVASFCSDVPRPAVILLEYGLGYLVADPVSGAECELGLGGDAPGQVQAAGEALYWSRLEGGTYVVRRMVQDGQVSELSFAAADMQEAMAFHTFIVSGDGSRIAWAYGGPPAGQSSGAPISQLWVASVDGEDVVSPLPAYESGDVHQRGLTPVRFSDDNSTLYYTVQPMGLGGSWIAFVGRYDNLYALRLNSDAEPTLIFDCAEHNTLLCIGDFYEVDGQVSALAYVDGGSVVIQNGEGQVLNTLTPEAEYVGYPTFGPGGELVFYSADIRDDEPLPERASLHRVAPPTAADEVLVSDPGLLPPQGWLDATRIIVGYTDGGQSWGTAMVGLDGSLRQVGARPNAYFAGVIPAP
ncbi:MAG TPA: hypothetical protein VK879_20465 [Candidatus Sulfomarinibacteraceae bacterium]|nr:hypothetical protein [Candidatus Sulfomarinibacteraceae bacterium]